MQKFDPVGSKDEHAVDIARLSEQLLASVSEAGSRSAYREGEFNAS